METQSLILRPEMVYLLDLFFFLDDKNNRNKPEAGLTGFSEVCFPVWLFYQEERAWPKHTLI